MNKILASITTLEQHLHAVANDRDIYRTLVCPHCSLGGMWCHGCYYRKLVTDYLKKYGQATRKDLDSLLLAKLADVLDPAQKSHKICNQLQAMRLEGLIHRTGPKSTAVCRWGAPPSEPQS